MTSTKSEGILKNYLYDNQNLKEFKVESCISSNFEDEDEYEVWMFQCPKTIDVSTLINSQISKSDSTQIEFDAEKFTKPKTLMVIKPEKAEEYELICDKVKIVNFIRKFLFYFKLTNVLFL